MASEAAHFLWEDTSFFEERYEKSASALIAVTQSLAGNPILGKDGEEFLALYDSMTLLPAELFSRVWMDPTAYFWARNAYDLTKLCMADDPLSDFFKTYGVAIQRSEPKEILAWHLQDFKKFVLGLHYLAGKDYTFATPYQPRLPLAIPGTELFLEGNGSVRLQGLIQGELVVSNGSGETVRLPLKSGSALPEGALVVGECPVVRQSDYELPLQLYSFNLPGFESDSEPALSAGMDFQAKQTGLVQEALALIERYHPRTFAQLKQFIRLMAFKPRDAGGYGNLSYSDLPGALICSAVSNAYEFAETLIHEFHHNRLFFVEEISPILLNSTEESSGNNAFYSPWRNDLRPLRGLLHALYVYTPVTQFWLNLYRSGDASDRLLEYASSQLIVMALQLQIGAKQLARYGEFSEMGQEVFPELQAGVEEIRAAVAALNLPDDAPTMVCNEEGKIVHLRYRETNEPLRARDRVLVHVEECDLDHQCDDLLKELSLV